MLEEVEVAPRLHDGVVRRAIGGIAVGTGKATTGRKVDLKVEPFFVGIEVRGFDHPRWHETESKLKQISVTHGRHS